MQPLLSRLLIMALLLPLGKLSAAPTRRNPPSQLIIHIMVRTSYNINSFYVDIYQYRRSVKLVYSILDSVDHKMEQDTAYQYTKAALMTKLSSGQPLTPLLIEPLKAITQKYEVYDRDSILIKSKADTAFVHLLQQVSLASKKDLVPELRIGIDGTYVEVKIITSQKTLVAGTPSPNRTSNPLLYQLISQSLHEFWKGREDSILAKKLIQRMSGY